MFKASRRFVLASALVVGTVGGCFYDSASPLRSDVGQCVTEAVAPAASIATPTYHQDIAPLAAAKCVECHREGGIAPFALDSYDGFVRRVAAVKREIEVGTMPPWQPAACCQKLRHDQSLSAEQRALFLDWLNNATPLGTVVPPPVRTTGDLPRIDLSIAMDQSYVPKPNIGADELRCFLLDHRFDERTFITGLNVVPGNRAMVHHVVLFSVNDDQAAALQKRNGQDGRPGWECRSATDELPLDGVVGGWQPGDRARIFPDGVGTQLKAGSHLVMNIHYDTGHGIGQDLSKVQLMVASTVAQTEKAIPIQNPLWFAGDGMKINANDPDASVFFSFDPTTIFTASKAVDISGVMLHMHEFGSSGKVAIVRANGDQQCILNIPRWDFHWMTSYELETPITLQPGDKLYVECHWDNSADHQKMVNGEFPPPRDLRWGADQEMCAAVVSYRTDVQP
jgi:hypothetical protein